MEISYKNLNNYVEVELDGDTLRQVPDGEDLDMWIIEKLSYWAYQENPHRAELAFEFYYKALECYEFIPINNWRSYLFIKGPI